MIYDYAVDLKRQNGLKVGTDKPKLKVKMQSVSDDDVLSWRRKMYSDCSLQGSCYLFRQGVPGLWASNQESSATEWWSLKLTGGTSLQKTISACRTVRSDRLPGRPSTGTSGRRSKKVPRFTSVKNSNIRPAPKRGVYEPGGWAGGSFVWNSRGLVVNISYSTFHIPHSFIMFGSRCWIYKHND